MAFRRSKGFLECVILLSSFELIENSELKLCFVSLFFYNNVDDDDSSISSCFVLLTPFITLLEEQYKVQLFYSPMLKKATNGKQCFVYLLMYHRKKNHQMAFRRSKGFVWVTTNPRNRVEWVHAGTFPPHVAGPFPAFPPG